MSDSLSTMPAAITLGEAKTVDDIQRLLDEAAIHRVLVQYCRGVDRGDEALIRAVYWPDATDDHGVFKGSGSDFSAMVVKALKARALVTQHGLQQVSIDLLDEVAHVESYFVARHKVRHEQGFSLETFAGRYVDRFEKRNGEWRIKQRQVVHDWSNVVPISAEYPHDSFAQGQRDRSDASYGR